VSQLRLVDVADHTLQDSFLNPAGIAIAGRERHPPGFWAVYWSSHPAQSAARLRGSS